MKPHKIQSSSKGLLVLVDGKEIYTMKESLFNVDECVLVKIDGTNAVLTDPSNKLYTEIWEVFHPAPVHVYLAPTPFKLIDLVENNLYFVTITLVSLTLSFFIGLLIGQLML